MDVVLVKLSNVCVTKCNIICIYIMYNMSIIYYRYYIDNVMRHISCFEQGLEARNFGWLTTVSRYLKSLLALYQAWKREPKNHPGTTSVKGWFPLGWVIPF